MAKLLIQVELDDKGAIKKVGKLEGEIKDVGQAADKASPKTEGLSKKFSGLNVGALAAVAGLAALGRSAFKLIELFGVQEDAEAQLNQTLLSTGHAAGLTFDELTKMASGLQAVTKFGDETIIKSQALLLTFTNIGRDIFPDVQEAILNVATAMDTDLQSATVQLGKALNDPVLGMTALSRSGITFTQDQKDVVKALVETGDVAGAQAIILKELNTQFGGQARAAAETAMGAWQQAKNILGDLGEVIGGKLAPALGFVARLVSNMSTALIAMFEPTNNVIASLRERMAPALETLKPLFDGLKTIFSETIPKALSTLAEPLKGLSDSLRGLAGFLFDHFSPVFRVVGFLLSNVVAPAVTLLAEVLGLLIIGIAEGITTVTDFADSIRNKLSTALAGLLDIGIALLEKLPNFIRETFGVSEEDLEGMKALSESLRAVSVASDEAAEAGADLATARDDSSKAAKTEAAASKALAKQLKLEAKAEKNLADVKGKTAAADEVAIGLALDRQAASTKTAEAIGTGAKTEGEAARKSIIAELSRALMTLIRKVIVTIPFPVNIPVAAAAAVLLKRTVERNIPKFAHGGSAVVGGSGLTDDELVTIRATRGETLRVTTPEQEAERAGGGDTFIFDMRDAIIGPGAIEEMDQAIAGLGEIGRSEITKVTVLAAFQLMRKGLR